MFRLFLLSPMVFQHSSFLGLRAVVLGHPSDEGFMGHLSDEISISVLVEEVIKVFLLETYNLVFPSMVLNGIDRFFDLELLLGDDSEEGFAEMGYFSREFFKWFFHLSVERSFLDLMGLKSSTFIVMIMEIVDPFGKILKELIQVDTILDRGKLFAIRGVSPMDRAELHLSVDNTFAVDTCQVFDFLLQSLKLERESFETAVSSKLRVCSKRMDAAKSYISGVDSHLRNMINLQKEKGYSGLVLEDKNSKIQFFERLFFYSRKPSLKEVNNVLDYSMELTDACKIEKYVEQEDVEKDAVELNSIKDIIELNKLSKVDDDGKFTFLKKLLDMKVAIRVDPVLDLIITGVDIDDVEAVFPLELESFDAASCRGDDVEERLSAYDYLASFHSQMLKIYESSLAVQNISKILGEAWVAYVKVVDNKVQGMIGFGTEKTNDISDYGYQLRKGHLFGYLSKFLVDSHFYVVRKTGELKYCRAIMGTVGVQEFAVVVEKVQGKPSSLVGEFLFAFGCSGVVQFLHSGWPKKCKAGIGLGLKGHWNIMFQERFVMKENGVVKTKWFVKRLDVASQSSLFDLIVGCRRGFCIVSPCVLEEKLVCKGIACCLGYWAANLVSKNSGLDGLVRSFLVAEKGAKSRKILLFSYGRTGWFWLVSHRLFKRVLVVFV